MSPFKGLLQSRKFWLVVIDSIGGLLALFAAEFWPENAKFIIGVWGGVQPVFIVAIGGIAAEDAAAKKAGVHPTQIEG